MFTFDKATPLTREDLTKRAKKMICIILAAGLLLIAADSAASALHRGPAIEVHQGNLYLIRPGSAEASEHITLDASVDTGYGILHHRYDLRVDPLDNDTKESADSSSASGSSSDRDSRELISAELRSLLAGINENTEKRRILLPAALTDGTPVTWHTVRKSNAPLLILLLISLSVFVYRNRLRPLEKQEEERKHSILTGLPSFLSELSLLMNAGLVLSSAFEKVVAEAGPSGNAPSDYFSRRLEQIQQSVTDTNASLQAELRQFARHSGVKDLVRVSNIISDNINKGADLTGKLEAEAEHLWISRKLHARQQGKIAETKMILPLSLFLCVLIMITVAPAMLQL